jgi:uncharacterized protein YndB with AHSA1/START domain
MPSVSNEITIARPVDVVFGALADPKVQTTYDSEMMRSVEQLTDGPIRQGTRFRGDFKGMGKVEYEYSQFEPNRLIEHAVQMPFGAMRHRFEFELQAGSTRLTQTIEARLNLLGQILWPLMMQRMMSKRVATLNGLVKRYVET